MPLPAGLGVVVITLMTARWWTIVHAENPSVPFLPLIRYRLAVFGLSYFTPGPQVGCEPLQVLYLQRRYGLTLARATSAVIMDKLLEFLVNFLLLGVGAWAVIRAGLISKRDQPPPESDRAGVCAGMAPYPHHPAISRTIARFRDPAPPAFHPSKE